MIKVYDYDNNRLMLDYDNISFDLQLRSPITQVGGDSATGKTLLYNIIGDLKKESASNWSSPDSEDVSNIYLINEGKDLDALFNIKGMLIIIDRFDCIIGDRNYIIDYIATDRDNHYLIFARRGYQLNISPNYYGSFIMDEGVIRVNFRYSVKGWF